MSEALRRHLYSSSRWEPVAGIEQLADAADPIVISPPTAMDRSGGLPVTPRGRHGHRSARAVGSMELPAVQPGQLWCVELPSEPTFSQLEYRALTTANVVIYDRVLAPTVARFLPIRGYAEPAAPSGGPSGP